MHRGLIVGAGRMGSGFGLTRESHYYTHARAYRDLQEKVELCAFVEPDPERAEWAGEAWGIPTYVSVDAAMAAFQPDIVSVCVQPDIQAQIVALVDSFPQVRGIWCEKPWVSGPTRSMVQVDYCRRFDKRHIAFGMKALENARLTVWGKKDIHTACHFTDLARFWRVKRDRFHYVETPGEPGAYMLRYHQQGKWVEEFFTKGGLTGDRFMTTALDNLISSVDGKAVLMSPQESAVESEKWANEILKG